MSPSRQLALLWAGVSLALIALSPLASSLAAGVPACPIRGWLDVPCLSCGTTRAALALARLDVPGALTFNPLAALGWIGLIVGGLAAGLLAVTGRRLPRLRLQPTRTLRLAIAATLLANWVYLIVADI